jgi:hypothetical protein
MSETREEKDMAGVRQRYFVGWWDVFRNLSLGLCKESEMPLTLVWALSGKGGVRSKCGQPRRQSFTPTIASTL